MANNPYKNKVIYNGQTLIDLTADTVSPESLLVGYTAHDSSGALIEGEATGGNDGVAFVIDHVNGDGATEREIITRDATITDTENADGATIRNIVASEVFLEEKTVAPTESAQNVVPSMGYDALAKVQVEAIPSDYIGSGVTQRSSSDLTVSGPTVNVPAGVYASAASKSVASGSVSVDSKNVPIQPVFSFAPATGLMTATNIVDPITVTATVSAGYVTSGTSGTINISGSNTYQLSTQSAATITPTESVQTAVSSGYFTTGSVTVGAISSTYVGSGIARRNNLDLTASGSIVTAPAGYYSSAVSKNVAGGAVAFGPFGAEVLPTFAFNSATGLVTASYSFSQQITPTVVSGYVSSAFGPTVSVHGSSTYQIPTLSAQTFTPGISNQTISAGKFLTGAQTILGDQNLTGQNIKSGVSIFGVDGEFQGGDVQYTRSLVSPQQTFIPDSSNRRATLSMTTGLEDGAHYVVTFDGAEWLTTCDLLWSVDYVIGEAQYFLTVADSACPFGIAWESGSQATVAVSNTSTHTIKIEKIVFLDDGFVLTAKTVTPTEETKTVLPYEDGEVLSEIDVSMNASTSPKTQPETIAFISGKRYHFVGSITKRYVYSASTQEAKTVYIDEVVVWNGSWSPSVIPQTQATPNVTSYVLTASGITITWTATESREQYNFLRTELTIYEAEEVDGLSQVIVNPIPSGYIIPSGTSSIISNGTYNVAAFASAEIMVPDVIDMKSLIEGSVMSDPEHGAYYYANDIVRTIGSGKFMGMVMWNFSFANVKSIGMYAFASCTVRQVSCPLLENIYTYAFAECDSLSSFYFPVLKNISAYAFYGCGSLQSADCPELLSIGNCAFAACTRLKDVNFPKVTNIGSFAFSSCSMFLSEVSFPEVNIVYNNAFYNCSKLQSVYFPSVSFFGAQAFMNCFDLTSVYAPEVTTVGNECFRNCSSLSTISLPNVDMISAGAFSACYNLKSIYSPSVTSIMASAFQQCSNLTDISMSYVQYLGSAAFSDCVSLSSIDFPSLTTANSTAFWGCVSLLTANLPELSTVGFGLFSSDTSLLTVSIPKATLISAQAFNKCSALESVYAPLVTSIYSGAFASCTNVSILSFPSLSSISAYAFSSCVRLISLYLMGSSVVTLAALNAFISTPISNYSTVAGRYGSIFVPSSLYDTYINATNWKTISARIVSM